MPKKLIHHLGTVLDRNFRRNNPRVDTPGVGKTISKARKMAFSGKALKNKDIEKILKPKSLTLTQVHHMLSQSS
jgi:hypothetical protein